MSFDQFKLDSRCLRLLNQQGISTPTPVQEQAIPVVLEGSDLTAIAQTGTGKTLAFALPTLSLLAAKPPVRNSMLVLTPTRELAHQVHKVFEAFGRALGLRTVCLYGGVGLEGQAQLLRRGCNVIVATPGRLLDHMERGNIRFDKLSIFVLDEADRMLDMGFIPAIRRIISELPKEKQTLMFSATFPKEMSRLAADMQHDPIRIEVGAIAKPLEAVDQHVYTVQSAGKLDLLSKVLREPGVESAIVFIRTKHRTDRVARALYKDGFKVEAIHGGRSQGQRQKAIDGFRQGRYKVLVATDVAARGLDIQGVTHVVNFDVPNSADDYIHRIGRTARASATGDAITFVSPDECMALGSIEKSLGRNLPRRDWDGAVPVLSMFNPNRPPAGRGKGARYTGRRGGRGMFRGR